MVLNLSLAHILSMNEESVIQFEQRETADRCAVFTSGYLKVQLHVATHSLHVWGKGLAPSLGYMGEDAQITI